MYPSGKTRMVPGLVCAAAVGAVCSANTFWQLSLKDLTDDPQCENIIVIEEGDHNLVEVQVLASKRSIGCCASKSGSRRAYSCFGDGLPQLPDSERENQQSTPRHSTRPTEPRINHQKQMTNAVNSIRRLEISSDSHRSQMSHCSQMSHRSQMSPMSDLEVKGSKCLAAQHAQQYAQAKEQHKNTFENLDKATKVYYQYRRLPKTLQEEEALRRLKRRQTLLTKEVTESRDYLERACVAPTNASTVDFKVRCGEKWNKAELSHPYPPRK